jgi:hypothetical protein
MPAPMKGGALWLRATLTPVDPNPATTGFGEGLSTLSSALKGTPGLEGHGAGFAARMIPLVSGKIRDST